MTEFHDSIVLEHESDEYRVTSVVAVTPTWRDLWAILRGRYRPKVFRQCAITVLGASRIMEEHYTPQLRETMHQPSLFRYEEPDD